MEEGAFRCLRSLVAATNKAAHKYPQRALRLVILDDRSSPAALDQIRRICQDLCCPWEIQTTHITGQGESLFEQFTRAKGTDSLCYFVEDDFLHTLTAIWEMWDFYRHIYETTGGHLMIHSQDDKGMYGTDAKGYYPIF